MTRLSLFWPAVALALLLGCGAATRDRDTDADAGDGSDGGDRPPRADGGAATRCAVTPITVVDQRNTLFRHDLAVDGDGVAYLGASTADRVYVSFSADGGETWMDTPDAPYGTALGRVAVAVTPTGAIYVATVGNNASGVRRGVLLRSPSTAGPWAVIDEFDAFRIFDLLVTPAGKVFVSGVGDNGSSELGWFVRTGTGPGTFATTEHIPGTEGQLDNENTAHGLAVTPGGTVYAVGTVFDGSNQVWTVRRSNDGVAWSPEDSYESTPNAWAVAVGIAVGPDGSLLTTGEAGEMVGASYYDRWLVRRRMPGGAWQTVHRLPQAAATAQVFLGREIAADDEGRIYTIGYRGNTNTMGQEFQVLGTTDSGASWQMLASTPYTGDTRRSFTFDHLAVAPDGTVWVSRSDSVRAGCPE